MVTERTKQVPQTVIDRSVVDVPEPTTAPTSPTALLWFVGQAADEFMPWGTQPKVRDRQLRAFWPNESYFASALGVVASRNAAFSWQVSGPPRLSQQVQDILENANMGEGWVDFITKVSVDLYTQDSGAFIEVVRATDSPDALVIGLNHLDASRCWHTGSPSAPVLYQDRKGLYHLLKWYQVVTLSELPAPVEGLYGIQVCALSRLLRAAQIIKNISIYTAEKTGGQNNRAIHLLAGITGSQIEDALTQQKAALGSAGYSRYIQPLIVASVDPKANIDVKTLELATLPDGWDQEVTWKHYISIIAMAFLEDFQTFAPLPGGGLGTSAQSQILHLKSRGKGPALFMKLVTHALNFKILSKAVEFKFLEQDAEQEKVEAEIQKLRAETRKLRIESGELLPAEARQLATDVGDLPQELLEAGGVTDATQQETVTDTDQAQSKEGAGSPAPFRFNFEQYV